MKEVIIEETITSVKPVPKTRSKKKTEENKEIKKKKKKPAAAAAAAAADTATATTAATAAKELKQGESVIDYERLHDALSESFSLDDRLGQIHFAPLISKHKKFGNGHLSSSTNRNSNQNPPTAKNRHAEIPPPAFMTSTRKKKLSEPIKHLNGSESSSTSAKKTRKKKQKDKENINPATLDSIPQPIVVSLPKKKSRQVLGELNANEVKPELKTNQVKLELKTNQVKPELKTNQVKPELKTNQVKPEVKTNQVKPEVEQVVPELTEEELEKERNKKQAKKEARKEAKKEAKRGEAKRKNKKQVEKTEPSSEHDVKKVPTTTTTSTSTREIPSDPEHRPKQKLKKEELNKKYREKQRPNRTETTSATATASAEEEEVYCHSNDVMRGKNRARFEKYMDPALCKQKLEAGELYEGTIRINKRNRSDAYVTCDNLEADIFINGQHDRNRALEGDTVIVQLLDVETIWAKKKESMLQKREQQQRHATAVEQPPMMEEGSEDKAKPKYVGKVVSISRTDRQPMFSGTLSIQQQRFHQQENETAVVDHNKHVKLVWFKPTDQRNPLIAIQLRYAPDDLLKDEEKYRHLLMVAKITRWPIDSNHPFGVVVRELGHIGNIVAETQAVLSDNKIQELPFGKKALNGLPSVPWSIQPADIEKRRDLRDTRIFTIDPATAKDLDDAVHIKKINEDEFEIGVHIADVSHFIKQHTALDHEAYDRGTSVYLCDRVIPMLPSLLCEELCSLNPGVERLAFSVIWKMDGSGQIKDTWFGKTVIKSCVKLAYEDAQSVIEGHGLPKVSIKGFSSKEVEQDIEYLYKISKQMRERRFSSGALSINTIRLSFQLNKMGEPCEVSIYEQKDANRLIEEFMLCANMSVAEKICQHYPDEALLRQHAPPHERSLNEFIKIADNLGYHFDGSTAKSIQESFNQIDNQDVKSVLQLLAVKPMQRAKYFCTGSTDINKFRHYALNVPLYTHFTSPIRRFADIIVHRQLQAALQGKLNCGYKKSDVQKTASHCNERREGAKNSQEQNIQLYLSHYLHTIESKTKKPVITTAIITHVLKNCFEILVPDYGLEKRVYMDALPIDRFVYDPHKIALSVYWKEGIEANREFDQGRKLDEDYIEPSGIQLYLEGGDPNDEDQASKTIYKIPDELLSDNLIDREKKMQRFEALSRISVRIQVNVERSPPIVNMYPVNPFM